MCLVEVKLEENRILADLFRIFPMRQIRLDIVKCDVFCTEILEIFEFCKWKKVSWYQKESNDGHYGPLS